MKENIDKDFYELLEFLKEIDESLLILYQTEDSSMRNPRLNKNDLTLYDYNR
jgi:hypothetical protein